MRGGAVQGRAVIRQIYGRETRGIDSEEADDEVGFPVEAFTWNAETLELSTLCKRA